VSNAILLAPPGRSVRLHVDVPRRAVVGLVAVALAALVAAGLPALWPSHQSGAQPVSAEGGITSLSVANSAQRLTASFGSGGATVSSGGARFTLGLTAFGRGAQLQAVAPVQPRLGDGLVRYQFPGAVTETWRNSSLGLEQGFVLADRPAGSGPLSVAMAAPAHSLLLGGAVLLPGGLRYAGLRATDARGRMLHSWLALAHGQLLIKVSDRGAQYPVRIDPLVAQAYLTANDGADGDYFGSSVAISGHTLVAGAPYHKVGMNIEQGAVYVFSDSSGHWKQTAELTVAGGFADQTFGVSVAISGKTVVASAPNSGTASQGALYVFSDSSGHWKQVAELTADDAGDGDHLGQNSVAIQGKTIIAGAPSHEVGSVAGQGAVYVFNEPAGGWHTTTQSAELTEKHGALDDWVGWTVAMSGNTIVAGSPAPYETDGHESAIFVFTKSAGKWTQTAEVHQKDVASVDDLGYGEAISGHTMAAGVSGGVYVFQSKGGKWKQTGELSGGGAAVGFAGHAILSGGGVLTSKGSSLAGVTEFREFSGKWRKVANQVVARNHPSTDGFYESFASEGKTVVVGMYNGDDAGAVEVLKGRVTSEGPLIKSVNSGAAGLAGITVTCELPAHATCKVTVGVHRTGSKQKMGKAKPKNIKGTDIRTITVHFNAAFNRLLSRTNGVRVTFKVRESSHGKVKFSGTKTIHFIPA
jgi:FG-GAP repeat protein